MAALDHFSVAARDWFSSSFVSPTPAQEQGWDAIRRGDHTLILAPTGSGKTLAAFFWALDRLSVEPAPPDERRRCRVLYVSPLKALTYDIERNLRAPLAGIGAAAAGIRIGIRTGDTTEKERRDIARHPPDILVTTPESLYLMLTSRAREVLASIEFAIVDEIHVMAATKRGAHLALSLERLDRLCVDAGGEPPQRVGLSATQRPLEEVARYLGGRDRRVTIVDAGVRKQLDLEVRGLPEGAGPDDETGLHPMLLDLIRSHTSTLIFVNSRRLAERLAQRLNEMAREFGDDADLVRAHHGSIARAQRLEIEDALKAGKLTALVATSSLELGIDMGAIDLVIQVESPASVATGLQRIGRAGHSVGQPSRGKIFPKFRGDLVMAAVTASRMQVGEIETTRVPKNPLDILAQHVVAMVAMEDWAVDDLFACVTRSYNFEDLTRSGLEGVLDMLSGRYPSDEFADLRPRIVWDRVEGTLHARAGAGMLAVTSGGTIPDRGLFGVFTPEGSRVGELDEEMVYETRVGENILLGATTWRVQEITRDRVVVTPAPGHPGKIPFWRGDALGRPYELGCALGRFLAEFDSWTDERLRDECGLDQRAIAGLRSYVGDERAATGGLLPSDRQIVIERFRDEVGDWRVCLLSPFGARVHAPWALALEARVRDRLGLEVQAIWDDDGIVLRMPEALDLLDDAAPAAEAVVIDPDEVEDLVVAAVGHSALFASRFRENAARALLLPRRRPGSRTPLWQMRQKAADLLAVASRYGSFPILLETYRECLSDVFDLPALHSLMTDIASGRVAVVAVDTPRPSPFASSLAFRYVTNFMYEGDSPVAERRAQALTLDRAMLAELLGADELRELLDPDVASSLVAELQCLDERRHARTVGAASDLLRRLGDLTADELRARCTDDFSDALVEERLAIAVDVGGEERLIVAEDAGRYRDGAGVAVPDGVHPAFLEPVSDALEQLVRRWARTHGPFVASSPAGRFGLAVEEVEEVLAVLESRETVVRGAFLRGGTGREWCDAEVLRMLRQRSLARLRREVEPVEAEVLGRFLPVWHGIGGGPGAREGGLDRLHEVVEQLAGVAVPASVLERDVLSARVRDYSPALLDELCAAGDVVWVGAGRLGRDDGRVMLHMRGSALARSAPMAGAGDRPSAAEHERLRDLLAGGGARFFRDLVEPAGPPVGAVAGARAGAGNARERATLDALWDLVWAGEVTNDAFAPLRALTASGKKRAGAGGRRRAGRGGRAGGGRLGTLDTLGPPTAQGRWSLVERGDVDATVAAHALAVSLLGRHGVVTREAVRGEGVAGGFASVYPVLRAMEDAGRIRRGYFVAGLGGAQFALPGAVDRLRRHRDPGTAGPDSGAGAGDGSVMLLAASDPANPYGLALAWPPAVGGVTGRPARAAGAYVVLLDGVPSLFVERRARSLVALRPLDGRWEAGAVAALDSLLDDGRLGRLVVEKVDPALARHLEAAGYVPTPKGWTRYR